MRFATIGLGLSLSTPAGAAAPPPAPAGDARGTFVVYCSQVCPEVVLDDFALRAHLPRQARSATAAIATWGPEYGLPDEATLADWGFGDVAGVATAQGVVELSWASPAEEGPQSVVAVGRAALATGDWIQDLDTGRIYDRSSFEAALEGYDGPTPDVTSLMVVESSEEGGAVRIVTRGLHKVALPELVMEGVPPERDGPSGIALNAIAQALFEQGQVSRQLSVDATRFNSTTAAAMACNARGQATLAYGQRLRDDPPAPLASVTWEGRIGACPDAAVEEPELASPVSRGVSTGEGPFQMPGTQVVPTAERREIHAEPELLPDPGPQSVPQAPAPVQNLKTVQAAALERFDTTVRGAWFGGLPDGDTLMVKAPFAAGTGAVEWLWIVVDEWDDEDVLSGRLANQPSLVEGLTRGDPVSTEVSMVFDYLWKKGDGTEEGNSTAEWIR